VDYIVKPLVPFTLRAKVAWFVELYQRTRRDQRQAEQVRQTDRSGLEETLAQERSRLREQQECLVEMHGGTAIARSEGLGKGSEFIIRLPLVKYDQPVPVAGPAGATELHPVSAVRALRILVVDDNVDAAQSLALLLRAYGHQVVDVVHDGPSAVEAILTKKPSVVLLDIGLPGMNGYEVAQRVLAEVVEQPPQLIAITGYGQESDKTKAQEVGIAHHLVKPVDPNRLYEILSVLAESSV
jgi:CheY-like chemotaxis protein